MTNSIVGVWKADLSRYQEKVYIDGIDLGEGEEDEDDPITVDDLLWGDTIRFFSDGTCTCTNLDTKGTYKLGADNEIEITFGSTTIKKGEWSKERIDEELANNDMGEFVKISDPKNESYKVVLDKDKLALKLVMSLTEDYTALASDPFSSFICKQVYGEDMIGVVKTEITETYTRVE